MEQYAIGLLFYRSDDLYIPLVLKNRPDWQQGWFNAPGGHIEKGETPVDAVVRKMYEEVGVHTDPRHWQPVAYINGVEKVASEGPRVLKATIVAFRAFYGNCTAPDILRDLMRVSKKPPAGDEEVCWFEADNITEDCLWMLRWLIPLAMDHRITAPLNIAYEYIEGKGFQQEWPFVRDKVFTAGSSGCEAPFHLSGRKLIPGIDQCVQSEESGVTDKRGLTRSSSVSKARLNSTS